MNIKKCTKLIGKELLTKLESVKGLSRGEQARRCGYVTGRGNIQIALFLQSIMDAGGTIAQTESGRRPSYTSIVRATGDAGIGASYISEIGWKIGDRLEIRVKENHIELVRISDLEDVKTGENS